MKCLTFVSRDKVYFRKSGKNIIFPTVKLNIFCTFSQIPKTSLDFLENLRNEQFSSYLCFCEINCSQLFCYFYDNDYELFVFPV